MRERDVLHRFYARLVTASAGVSDPRIEDAFATVPREHFLGPGPWPIKVAASGYMSSETDDPAVLYQDIVVGLVPSRGLNNGQPSLHAKCMGAVLPQPGDRVVHVGAGTGYYTAILSMLVTPGGRVDAYEVDPHLARRASDNLARHANVAVHATSAVDGVLPAADVIYVSAGVTDIPPAWRDALAPEGRLVVPLTPAEGLGVMLLVTRMGRDAYAARVLSTAAFIPCVGATDPQGSRAVVAALAVAPPDAVRSLRVGVEPDDTAWFRGDGWWLSTWEP